MDNLEHLRDKIAAVIDANYDMPRGHDLNVTYLANAILAALPDMIPDLVWYKTTSGTGKFPAWVSDPYLIVESLTFGGFHMRGREYPTLEAAKAACNAHHKAQIIAALGGE